MSPAAIKPGRSSPRVWRILQSRAGLRGQPQGRGHAPDTLRDPSRLRQLQGQHLLVHQDQASNRSSKARTCQTLQSEHLGHQQGPQRRNSRQPVELSAATSAMASQMAGTAGSWLRACRRAATAGPDAPCSAGSQSTLGTTVSALQPHDREPGRRFMFSAGPTVLLLTLGTLTSIQARQGHPGRHTLGVQLESTRQRILAGGGLQEGVSGSASIRTGPSTPRVLAIDAFGSIKQTAMPTSAATAPSAAHRSGEAPSRRRPARATRSAAAVRPSKLGAPEPAGATAGWARSSCRQAAGRPTAQDLMTAAASKHSRQQGSQPWAEQATQPFPPAPRDGRQKLHPARLQAGMG